MDAMHRKAIKIISLFVAIAFLLLLPILIAEAANDIASSFQVNNTAVELTATWTEYATIGGFATGIGNTTVTITVNTATNSSTARSYGRIKRDGIVIESFNLSQSFYPETVTYIAPMAETEATHNYSFEAYCTAGKKCTLYNRTFSATFIKTGSFAASVTNVTALSPLVSTYGATPELSCPNCITNSTAKITRQQVTNQTVVDDGQNTSITNIESTNVNQNTSITNIETVNTDQNTSITNIQNVNIAQNTSISSINTSVALNDSYRQNNDTDIRAAMNVMNTSTAANRTESQNMANSINTTLTAMNSSSAANATTAQNMANSINSTLTAMNGSTAANYTTAQNMANSINSTKANKTNISEFTGGTIADILFFFSLNGTNATALAANTTANNTNATLTTHTATTGTAVHGLGNMSTQNKTAVDITGGNISGISAWTTLNNTVSPNVSAVRNLTTDNVTEGSINQYFTNARVYTVGNVTYLKLGNITTCTGGTNRSNFNGTWFTCETDQTSAFSLNIVGGDAVTGAAILSQGSGITITQNGNNFTFTSEAASVTNATVNPYNLNGSNVTSGLINYSYLKNVSVNLTSGVNVTGLLPDANLASTFVKTVGATSPCTSTGGVNPSISCSYPTNATVNPQNMNASNITSGVLPNAGIPLSAANLSANNIFTGSQNDFSAGKIIAKGGNSPTTGGFWMPDTAGVSQPRITSDGNNATIIRPGSAGAFVQFNNFANNQNLFTITDVGKVGIATNTTPGHDLAIGTGTWSAINAGSSTFTTSSSKELKDNITEINISESYERISKLTPKTFEWNKSLSPNSTDKTQWGLIADETNIIYPDMQPGTVDWSKVLTDLVAASKQLIFKVKKIENQKMDKVGDNASINRLSVEDLLRVPRYAKLPQTYPVAGIAYNTTDESLNVMKPDGWYIVQTTRRE